jgi:hypothetical protein
MQQSPYKSFFSHSSDSSDFESYQRKQAQSLYTGILSRGKAKRLSNFLKGRSTELLNLDFVVKSICLGSRHYSGVKSVEISKIRGSEGRSKDFDISFRPLLKNHAQRWQSVATARLENKSLPPVELVQVGNTFFVRDGHHRISVSKALGEEYIDAVIVSWDLCDPKDATHPALSTKA